MVDVRRSRIPPNVTDPLYLPEYFNSFSSFVLAVVPKPKKKAGPYLKETVGLTEQEYGKLSVTFSPNKYSWKTVKRNEKQMLLDGFLPEFNLFDIPENPSLQTLKSLSNPIIATNKRRPALVRYRGEVSCNLPANADEDKKKVALKEYSDYLLTVRVYCPATFWSYSSERRTKPLIVSQEFLLHGKQSLVELRDRILCPEDFNSVEGDVSESPFAPTKFFNGSIYKSSMFFINNIFYVDRRDPRNLDYSLEVKEWAKLKNLPYNVTESMESTTFDSLTFRLGYPYLFMHQGRCEHLIIFTDARLINPLDLLAKAAYPIMISFASLRGRRCSGCAKKIPKFIVEGMITLPKRKCYLCGLCLWLYCYDEHGNKVGDFRVYKHVEHVAIL